MKVRTRVVLGAAAALAASSVAVAPAAQAAQDGAQTCWSMSSGSTVEVESCNYQILIKVKSGCAYGHFKVWNQWNGNQYRNSADGTHCSSFGWANMGTAWSGNSCGTFYKLANGVYTEWGGAICNNDS